MMMRFVGKKASMGYVPQGVYPLEVKLTHNLGKAMIVVTCPGHVACPYESMESFLQNWDKE